MKSYIMNRKFDTLIFFTLTRSIYGTRERFKNTDLKNIQILSHFRLYSQLNPPIEKGLSPGWVSGFTDAEASFSLKIIRRAGYKLGWGVEPSFIIGLHAKELPLLEKIQAFFGVGNISIGNNNSVTYYVSSVNDLIEVIIPHFDKFPLITQKRADFLLFKFALEIINNKEHKKSLTYEYISKLISIKATLNWGLSDVLKEAFPDIAPALRPNVELPKHISPEWLAGFIDGEGCFYVLVSNSKLHKAGASVQLQFSITQHNRDNELMTLIKDFLNCGFIKNKKNQPSVEIVVTRLSDIQNNILPFLQKNPLQGAKLLDYLDFVKVVELMKNKAHLTPEGVDQIKKIKSEMNKKRKS